MSGFANPSVEDETQAMRSWWARNCKPFTEWFMKLSDSDRLALLRKGCPDLPKVNSATRLQHGKALKATDMLLPEISEDALMACGGQLCVLFITRRMVTPDNMISSDIKMLRDLATVKQLPLFNTGAAKDYDTAFVDPADPEENVQCLGTETTIGARAAVNTALKQGQLASVEVWMALKVRRTAIARFIRTLLEDFEVNCDELWKPKPLLVELMAAEAAMKASDAVATIKGKESSIEGLC